MHLHTRIVPTLVKQQIALKLGKKIENGYAVRSHKSDSAYRVQATIKNTINLVNSMELEKHKKLKSLCRKKLQVLFWPMLKNGFK